MSVLRAAIAIACGLALGLGAGCAKKAEQAPAADERPEPLPAPEVKRGQDACAAYVEKVCACTAPSAAEACRLAKALPEAIAVGLDIVDKSDVDRATVIQAKDAVRKTFRECIEKVAALPTIGC